MAKCGETCEVWKTIPGIPTHEASSLGRIRSKDRISEVITDKRKYKRKIVGRILKQNSSTSRYSRSYLLVSINDKTYSVHRLVASAFCHRDEGKDYVNHIDGNKQNNKASNLEWCTCSENEKHSYNKLGKMAWNKGKRYDTSNAVHIRKTNHMKFCKTLLEEWRSGKSKRQLSINYNRCYRQICDNINKALCAERLVS